MGKLIAINISEKRGTEKKKYRKHSWLQISGLPEMHMQVNGTGRSVFIFEKSKISKPEEPELKTEPSGRI